MIDGKRVVTILWWAWEVRIVWNWPTVALSRGCWRYEPEDDERRSFSRTRIGLVKVEVTRW